MGPPPLKAMGDADYFSILDEADVYARCNGLDLPDDLEAREIGLIPDCVTNPMLELNLADADVRVVLWATGYSVDFSWLKVDTFDPEGQPRHQRGISEEPGV